MGLVVFIFSAKSLELCVVSGVCYETNDVTSTFIKQYVCLIVSATTSTQLQNVSTKASHGR